MGRPERKERKERRRRGIASSFIKGVAQRRSAQLRRAHREGGLTFVARSWSWAIAGAGLGGRKEEVRRVKDTDESTKETE
jgi:hypothetical protein